MFAEHRLHRVEVLNFGVTGYNAEQVAESVRVKVLPFAPDLIVWGYCLNDPQDYSAQFEQLLRKVDAAAGGVRWIRGRASPLVLHSRLAALLHSMYEQHVTKSEAPPRYPLEEMWRDDPQIQALDQGRRQATAYYRLLHEEHLGRVEEAVARIRSLTAVPLVVVIFPLLNLVEPESYSLQEPHDLLVERFSSWGAEAIDLAPTFQELARENIAFHKDPLHPNRIGSERVAEVLYRWIVARNGVPDEPPRKTR